ncbi:hypothetical protein BU14_0403s0009 [Porphyra umbilicalis]|uniref:Uncharacterized protein n=1 Tax=Porphyra umbilicalis TaxID=2786 RepID=A0A1X6NWC2_PORUM|nr:hypothetical protein BU14_0403s0009 [Porphyra umbilicalis]|eukprot:OSX72806.1 hypothetical protein BU14_0403s0009 [Porphyra umbilicalis]
MGVSPSSTPPSSPPAPSPSRTLSLSTHYQCHSGRLVPRDRSSAPHPAPWIRMPPLPRRLPRRLQHLVMLPRTLPAPQACRTLQVNHPRASGSAECAGCKGTPSPRARST